MAIHCFAAMLMPSLDGKSYNVTQAYSILDRNSLSGLSIPYALRRNDLEGGACGEISGVGRKAEDTVSVIIILGCESAKLNRKIS